MSAPLSSGSASAWRPRRRQTPPDRGAPGAQRQFVMSTTGTNAQAGAPPARGPARRCSASSSTDRPTATGSAARRRRSTRAPLPRNGPRRAARRWSGAERVGAREARVTSDKSRSGCAAAFGSARTYGAWDEASPAARSSASRAPASAQRFGVAADCRRARLAARERGRRERRRAVEEQAPRHPHVRVAGPERGRREEAAAVVREAQDLGGASSAASLKPRIQLRRGSRIDLGPLRAGSSASRYGAATCS